MPCSLTFTDEELVVDEATVPQVSQPVLHFEPATTGAVVVRVLTTEEEVVASYTLPAGTSAFYLSQIKLTTAGEYLLDVFDEEHPNTYRNIPRYIVKADGGV